MGVIIGQSDRSPERLMISHTPRVGGTSNQLRWENKCGRKSPSFWGEFYKTLPSQTGYTLPSKIVEFWTFHISVFVNTTAMVVSYGTK